MILTGMVVFGMTRPIQIVWVGLIVIGGWNDEHMVRWQGIMQLSFTVLLSVIQVWCLTINYSIWKRCLNNIKEQAEVESSYDGCKLDNSEVTLQKTLANV